MVDDREGGRMDGGRDPWMGTKAVGEVASETDVSRVLLYISYKTLH